MNTAISGLRWVFGLFYACMGAVSLTFRLLGKPFVTPVNNAQEYAFASALTASGFVDQLITLTCLVGGVLVLVRRTTPLGLAMLTPLIVGIFLYHLALSKSLVIGNVQLALLLVLVWHYRASYRSLWRYGLSSAA